MLFVISCILQVTLARTGVIPGSTSLGDGGWNCLLMVSICAGRTVTRRLVSWSRMTEKRLLPDPV